MELTYLKKMTKQDLTRSVTVCSDSVESFWGISLSAQQEYIRVNLCAEDDPNNCPTDITIHKGYQGIKDWRITGASFKSLYAHRDPDIGDIMCVRKVNEKFLLSIIKKTDKEYQGLSSLFKANDNYVLTNLDKESLPSQDIDINLSEYIEILKEHKNMIFTGAPGTGKTFLAKQIAAAIISGGSLDWAHLRPDQKMQIGFTQFHPSYDYTDFVEGLRPNKDGNFIRTDGVFKKFCKTALKETNELHKEGTFYFNFNEDKKLPYIFIIDEINRGELSKIFGELFYSIEPDYRGEVGRVTTQYNNMVEDDDVFKDGFYIPENVYIIGTMNDVDRGVEAMDFAIRRRFAWKEVTAEESAINMGLPEDVKKVMRALNTALTDNGLSQAYHIGGAYFRKLDGSNYEKLWENHLRGIVSEYFRGDPDADKKVKEIADIYKRAYTATALETETVE